MSLDETRRFMEAQEPRHRGCHSSTLNFTLNVRSNFGIFEKPSRV